LRRLRRGDAHRRRVRRSVEARLDAAALALVCEQALVARLQLGVLLVAVADRTDRCALARELAARRGLDRVLRELGVLGEECRQRELVLRELLLRGLLLLDGDALVLSKSGRELIVSLVAARKAAEAAATLELGHEDSAALCKLLRDFVQASGARDDPQLSSQMSRFKHLETYLDGQG
ncbi:MAG: hypothetical protein LOX97_09600, partial [Sphingomonas sp.]|nr:hypothetical protein [Sphingomonas sp.]